MSRGSEIAIGLVALIGAIMMFINAPNMGATPLGQGGGIAMALGASVIATACLVKKGRHITTRVMAGVIAFGTAIGLVGILSKGEMTRGALFLGIVTFCAGIYAATGRYPNDLPMGDFFGSQSSKRKKKNRKKSRQIRTPQPPPEL